MINNFDFFRFLAATLVIYSHAFPLSGNGYNGELFVKLTNSQMSGGSIGVGIFFLMSGYLIAKSWDGNPNIAQFVRKRILRIIPGLMVCVLVSMLVIGPIYTALPIKEYFFHNDTISYIKNVFLWETRFTLGGTFVGLPYANVINGSLWTLKYEIRCYLILLMLGIMGI